MVNAIVKESGMRNDYLIEPVETIYFGGGTPSLLAMEEARRLLDAIHSNFNVTSDAEVTLEANPDDITGAKLSEWRSIGINRLSIGVQSFFDEDLQWMNRAHDASQAVISLKESLAHFNNITIDLIYGTPTLTDENWQSNVDKAIGLGIPHLSCYALTVEPRTALDTLVRQKKKEPVDPDKQARHFESLMRWMKAAGYEHYEISNFAKPGFRSRHNSSYWKGHPYLGLGPSAHSFNGREREWNISNNALYLDSIAGDILPAEKEVLTGIHQLNEYIMISLRTAEGLSLEYIAGRWGADVAGGIKKDAAIFLREGTMTASGDILYLVDAGKLLADGIAARLFR